MSSGSLAGGVARKAAVRQTVSGRTVVKSTAVKAASVARRPPVVSAAEKAARALTAERARQSKASGKRSRSRRHTPVVVPEPPKPPPVDNPAVDAQRVSRVSGLMVSIPRINRPSQVRSPETVRDDDKRVVCKARPKDNRPKGGGGGGKPRRFVPWC